MVIQDKFKTIKKIGSGAFGEIFKGKLLKTFIINLIICSGTNLKTGEECAIKLEPGKTKFPQLYYEAKLYKIFNGAGKLSNIDILYL